MLDTLCHLLHLSSVLLNAKLFFLCENVTVRNMVFAACLLQRLSGCSGNAELENLLLYSFPSLVIS